MARLVLSQNERLLLHLSELDKHRDDPEVPIGASQEGISQRLQLQIHNVSRALSSLQAEGLVSDRLAHVRGAPKRRRAYFLTEKGRLAAQAIRSDVAKRLVVLELEGKAQEMPLEEAIRRIASSAGATPAFNDIVDLARSNESIRTADLPKPGPKAAKECVERAQGRPKVELFFGREAEKKAVMDSISNPDIAAILLWGMPGIGKSTLASKVFDELSGKRSMFWHSFREWSTDASFLASLSEFLNASGRTNTLSATRRGAASTDLFIPLLNDLSGGEFLLFLDDFQKPSRQLSALSPILLDAVKASRSSKVVLMARSVPEFFSKTETGNVAFELSGLDRDSSWRLAQSLKAQDTVRVVSESHGHPLLINLMSRGGVGEAKGDVIAFIEREVYSGLSKEERRALELLSVFRHPVPVEALQAVDYAVLAKLRQSALLVEQEDGVTTHDLLREFFSKRLGAEAKASFHRSAAGYCEKHAGVEWKLETLFHNVEARDWDVAKRFSVASAAELAKEFPEETLALVSRIPKEDTSPREYAEILFIRGQLHEAMGNHEVALADLEHSLSLLSEESDSERRAVVLETVAKLQSQVQRWSESLSAHEKALHLYEKSNDREGQAREWMNIGGVHRRTGNLAKARQAYSKALSLATMQEDRFAQAACLNNLGLLDWDEGRLRDAEMRLKESVRLAHVVRDHVGEARGLENLASLFKTQLKLSESTNLLLESAEAFRRAGEFAEFKRLQAECASSLGEQGRFVDGIELCENALKKPELRRRKGLFQRHQRYDLGDIALSAALVDLLRSSGDFKEAQKELGRYMEMAEAVGDPSVIARGKLMAALVHEDSDDLDSAMRHLGEAEALLRGAGNSEGLIAVHMRTGIIEEKRGNDEAASEQYLKAAHHAEMAGNKYAYGLAMENLESVRRR